MKLRTILVGVVGLCLSAAVWAGKTGDAQGTINTVKVDDGKLNITHGPIAGLGMPGMTMDFNVMDPSMLDDVGAGDKVKFTVEEAAGGRYVITDIAVLGKGGTR
jgi:Cu/Ag efflux protein CusF